MVTAGKYAAYLLRRSTVTRDGHRLRSSAATCSACPRATGKGGTPFKEYVLRDEIVWREVAWIALGGVGGGHWLGGRKAPPMAWPTFNSTTPPMSSASVSRSRRS